MLSWLIKPSSIQVCINYGWIYMTNKFTGILAASKISWLKPKREEKNSLYMCLTMQSSKLKDLEAQNKIGKMW